MRELVFATGNPHKLEEVRAILNLDNYNILSLSDIDFNDEIEETAPTLEGNALLKARAIYNKKKINVFAEDTGLEVVALDMAPGVITARYAGPHKNNEDNMALLLSKMEENADRRARFRTVAALILNGVEHVFEGEVWGEIALTQSGEKGFGYDPIFIPDGYTKSFAELPDTIKNIISHRYNAISKLAYFLEKA